MTSPTPLLRLLSSQPGEPPLTPPPTPRYPASTFFDYNLQVQPSPQSKPTHNSARQCFRLEDASGKQRARGKAHFTSGPVRGTNFDTSRWSVTMHWSFPLPKAGLALGSGQRMGAPSYSLCHCELLALGLVYLKSH